MPIPVACSCGQKFAVKDELAGKRVKCPKCGGPLSIPAASGKSAAKAPAAAKPQSKAKDAPHDSVFDEIGLTMRKVGHQDCPECGASLPEDAVLCIDCGYNFKLGRRLQTLGTTSSGGSTKSAPTPSSHEATQKKSEIDKMLEFAEDELEKEPVKQEMGYGTRWSAWLIALVMMAVFAGVLAGGMAFFNYMEGEAAQKAREKAAGKN